MEKTIHTLLAPQHQRGEWFAVEIGQGQLEELVVRATCWLADAPDRKTAQRLAHKADQETRNIHAAHQAAKRAARIRLRRLELRLSQKGLGTLIGQDQAYVSRLEHGQITDITVRTLEGLAAALQVNVESLLKPDEEEDSEPEPTALALAST
jgi:DNA-binding Xre family transcriptional regulator